MNKVKVRTVEQPLHRLLLPAAALALGAAVVVGTGAVRAQEEAASAGGIDGAWAVDTSIGDFAEFTSSWVGFRVAEVLSPGGEVEAVGRTPLVSGGLEASGTIIENAVIEADLTGIVSDRSRRDPAIQRALETGDFPTAIFESTAAVDLGEVPADNVPFSASVPGTLTIRDVSQEVTLELDGQRVGDVVVVVGTLPVDFTSFGVTMPTAPIVVSVEDSGDLEWQLFLTREQATAEDGSGDDMATDADATADGEDGTNSDDMTEDAPVDE